MSFVFADMMESPVRKEPSDASFIRDDEGKMVLIQRKFSDGTVEVLTIVHNESIH